MGSRGTGSRRLGSGQLGSRVQVAQVGQMGSGEQGLGVWGLGGRGDSHAWPVALGRDRVQAPGAVRTVWAAFSAGVLRSVLGRGVCPAPALPCPPESLRPSQGSCCGILERMTLVLRDLPWLPGPSHGGRVSLRAFQSGGAEADF